LSFGIFFVGITLLVLKRECTADKPVIFVANEFCYS
jgi:hypothetical protein